MATGSPLFTGTTRETFRRPLYTDDAPWVSVEDTGAQEGNFDSTKAFVDAHAKISSNGGRIIVPGDFRIEPSQFSITKPNVRIAGESWFHSAIRRGSNTNGHLIAVSGVSFQMTDLLVADFGHSDVATNTGVSLSMTNINDVTIRGVWLQDAYECCVVSYGSNYNFLDCIVESGRLNGLRGVQASSVRVIDSAFYTTGVVATSGLGGAALKITKDAAYSFRPNGWKVVGCEFVNTNIGHVIYAVNASGLLFVANSIDLAGRFEINTYDEYKLENCRDVEISGYVNTDELNSYRGGVISGATNASPIVITTAAAHNLSTGETVTVRDVGGNTAANGFWTVTVLSATTASLTGTTGSGAYTSGGIINSRTSRYNVNIDANCRGVDIGRGRFSRGVSGTINDLAPDTAIWRMPLKGSVNVDIPALGAWGSGTEVYNFGVPVAGAVVGDFVTKVALTTLQGGCSISAGVTSAGNVNVVITNAGGGPTADPGVGMCYVEVMPR